MDQLEDYGERQVSKITVLSILEECNLKQEDIDILTLRFSYEWYYADIAEYVGMKYRGKPYSEGNIRYRIRKALRTIRKHLRQNNIK